MNEQKFNYLNCLSTEIGGLQEISPNSTDLSPFERANFPITRYKKSHTRLRNGKTNFLETPLSPDSATSPTIFSRNTNWEQFVFKTPERNKHLNQTEIKTPSRPTQKCYFQNLEILRWGMNLNQNETRSNISDSASFSASNRDTSFSFGQFNRFFEDLEDNSTSQRLNVSDFELGDTQRNQNLLGAQILTETGCQTLQSAVSDPRKPGNLDKLETHRGKQPNGTQGRLLIVNPNVCTYQDKIF